MISIYLDSEQGHVWFMDEDRIKHKEEMQDVVVDVDLDPTLG